MRPWLPADFVYPSYVPVPPGHHLRPIRASDVDLDFPAVMSSRERLWTLFGEPHGWPEESLTYEEDRAGLARHEVDMEHGLSFNYALFNDNESYLGGCVYIDPPERIGADADISFWVIDELLDSEVAASLELVVRQWISESWPFENPRFITSADAWAQWLSLPPLLI